MGTGRSRCRRRPLRRGGDRQPPDDLVERARRRRPRRGAGSSSSRGRPLRRGSSGRQERPQPARPALRALDRASSTWSCARERRRRSSAACRSWFDALGLGEQLLVRAERSSNSASSPVIARPERFPWRHSATPRSARRRSRRATTARPTRKAGGSPPQSRGPSRASRHSGRDPALSSILDPREAVRNWRSMYIRSHI